MKLCGDAGYCWIWNAAENPSGHAPLWIREFYGVQRYEVLNFRRVQHLLYSPVGVVHVAAVSTEIDVSNFYVQDVLWNVVLDQLKPAVGQLIDLHQRISREDGAKLLNG